MEHGRVERRRGRRANVRAKMLIKRLGQETPQASKEEVTQNLSLAGAYFETDPENQYKANEFVMTSVAVPESQVRDFPFTRLAGKGRIVRVSEVSAQEGTTSKRIGVALEFGEDLTALSALPARG